MGWGYYTDWLLTLRLKVQSDLSSRIGRGRIVADLSTTLGVSVLPDDDYDLMDDRKRRELRYLFLNLWDKAVATEGYNKKEWQRLEYLIGLLLHPIPPSTFPPPRR